MQKSNVEYEALLEGLLTQETSFFRYPSVYEAFEKRVLPELHVKKFWKNPRTLRIWSAGCSTGEEPYSIAITIADSLSFTESWNVEILATDVGRHALKQAERGVYTGRSLGSVSPERLAAHFTPVQGGHQVKPRLRKLVTFAQMNLASAVYVGRMDMIFCMNVLIYFSEERRRAHGAALFRHARARGLFVSWPFGIDLEDAGKVSGHRIERLHPVPQADAGRNAKAGTGDGGTRVSMPDREAVEMFLQEASEHLQYLREYVSVLQEISPRREDLERLYISAHTLSGTSASYGFPRFSEIAAKACACFPVRVERASRR